MVNTINMATRAIDPAMRAVQRENLRVIEIRHTVNPIVAVQADLTILVDMEAHELRPLLVARRMAAGAQLCIHSLHILPGWLGCMAIRARQGLAVEAVAMLRQAEAGVVGMLESRALPVRRQPAIGRMTIFAPAIEHTVVCCRL
jgi:hypothetical protein